MRETKMDGFRGRARHPVAVSQSLFPDVVSGQTGSSLEIIGHKASANMAPPRIAVDCNPPAASAINCNSIPPSIQFLPSEVAYFVENSLAANTKRAYLSDLEHFLAWGGLIPATDQTVALYLAEHAGQQAVATLARRIVGISKAHSARGISDPVKSELVRATMRGIRRRHGSHQRQAKPLLLAELVQLVSCLGDSAKDVRDRALLLLGFAGAFRRSELVGLDVEDLTYVSQGVLVNLRRSKSDQLGKGRTVAVPAGRAATCPVNAVERWLSLSEAAAGPLFTRVNRHGAILEKRLSAEAVSLILKGRLLDAGRDPAGYSGHSLRAGLATSAAQCGVPSSKIRAQTGHASDNMLNRYIRDAELFMGNAAGALL